METSGRAVPTGCYKCGRPGHWSRDCPSDPVKNPLPGNPPPPSSASTTFRASGAASGGKFEEKSGSKPKKLPRSRPKLTPQLLLSDDGLGYILRHFPRNFKFRGRGHEVSDLGNLIGMYREWHSHLLPYYSFDQFVLKVEKVAATKQVKRCIRELRDRVAHGGDPTKLHEGTTEADSRNNDQAPSEAMNVEDSTQPEQDSPFNDHNADGMQEDLFNDIFEKATQDPSPTSFENDMLAAAMSSLPDPAEQTLNNQPSCNVASPSTESRISDEQKARMEANRLKALIRMSDEQKSRMEANRLKALERAASRARPSEAA